MTLAQTALYALLLCAPGAQADAPDPPVSYAPVRDGYLLPFADDVVQGTVLDARTDRVPWREAENDSDYVGHYIKVTFVTMAVDTALKGFDVPDTLLFAVRPDISRAFGGTAGMDIVVGLWETSDVPRTTYEFKGESELFVRVDDAWVSQRTRGKHTIDDIRALIARIGVPSLSRTASAVFVGTVEAVRDSVYRDGAVSARIRTIALYVDERVAGEIPDRVVIEDVEAGDYWPEWRSEMPQRVVAGERYVVFAGRSGDVLYALGGVNGFLLVDGDRLRYDHRIELPYGLTDLMDRVRECRRSGLTTGVAE